MLEKSKKYKLESCMKKILFIVPSLQIGGMERMQVVLANALDTAGYEVSILLLNNVKTLAHELNKGITVIYKSRKNFHVLSRIKYVWTFYDDGKWERRVSPYRLHKYYIGNEHYDVEIAFFRGLPIKIIGFKSKKVIHLAWVHSDFRKATGYLNDFKSPRDVKKAYATYKKVICVSKEAEEGFKEIIGDTHNLQVIYNMLPIDEILVKSQLEPTIRINKGKLHVVLVGRLVDSTKGQKRLVKVISRLHKEGCNITLALIGGGVDEKLLQNEIEKFNASSYITMTGSQLNPYPYIKEADLLICASYFEGYNLTIAEALILGVPVMSTDCTGPNEILDKGKYGMIVENSENGIYTGLKNFYEDPSLLDMYRNKAKDRRKFFDDEAIFKQITSLF